MSTFTQDRDLGSLHPKVRQLAERFVAACAAEGIEILITETARSNARQRWLAFRGKSRAGSGGSYHNYGMAFDFVPLVDGQPVWDRGDLWQRAGELGEGAGLEWGGRWDSFPDKPHLQYTGGLSIPDLKRGQRLTEEPEFVAPDWAAEGIAWAEKEGIITQIDGKPMTDFRLAVILHNFAKKIGKA